MEEGLEAVSLIKILEIIQTEWTFNFCLSSIIEKLLEEKKGEEGVFFAEHMLRDTEIDAKLCSTAWASIIQFFSRANDPLRAYTLIDHLDLSTGTNESFAFKLALQLLQCDQHEQACDLLTKCLEIDNEVTAEIYLLDWATALAQKGGGKEIEAVDVALHLADEGKWSSVGLIIKALVECDHTEEAIPLKKISATMARAGCYSNQSMQKREMGRSSCLRIRDRK